MYLRKSLAAALAAAVLAAAGLVCGAGKTVFADSVKISEAFPDRAFRDYVSSNIDSNGDGDLTDQERNAVDTIVVHAKEIGSLEGIEYFPNLESLVCTDNNIKTIDLSQNTRLKRLSCDGNKIKELDLTHNVDMEMLDCNDKSLKKIDITGCTKLIKCISAGWNAMANPSYG